jgi:hypothetical protein
LRGLVAALLLALGGLLAGGSPAYACSCAYPPEAPELVDLADVVFTGRVVEERVVGSSRFLTFAVDRVYKGDAAARQRVRTHAESATCGLDLDGTDGYVLQGRGTAADLNADLCGGTRPGNQVLGLGPGRPPRPGGDGPSLLTAEFDQVRLALGAAVLSLSVVAAVLLVRRRRRSTRPER